MEPRAVFLPRLLMLGVTLASLSCNTRTPVLDNPVITTAPTTWTDGPSTPASRITTIEFAPGGTIGGGSGRGTLIFDFPVPAGGMAVTLATSDSVVRVEPTTVTVPAGSLTANFFYTTQPVTADTIVNIVASAPEGSLSAPLGVWAVLPTFFSYSSDRGAPVGNGRTGRFTPPTSGFSGSCSDSFVSAVVSPPTGISETLWFVGFGAPRGTPLRPGTYENATGTGNGNRISVNPDPFCQPVGRFTVHESEVTVEGRVLSFWATFEQACAGRPGVVRGDLRLTNMPRSSQATSPCVR